MEEKVTQKYIKPFPIIISSILLPLEILSGSFSPTSHDLCQNGNSIEPQ